MSVNLTENQIDDLLIYCGTSPTYWKNNECLVCCPVHGESHPSMGVNSELQVCHCFSCGFAGDFASLLIHSRPDDFRFIKGDKKSEFQAYKRARKFIADRYELEFHELDRSIKSIKRYEQVLHHFIDLEDDRVVLPLYKIAPFKSGKETYNYFFERGFTKEDMKTFMIGRDTDSKTVTIPVFYEDHKLAGVIGRYIDSNRLKNQRYKIYFEFKRGSVLYPVDKVEISDDTVILVEGQFDAIRMYDLGYKNTLAIMTNNLSVDQAEWLCKKCSTVIWVCDNDERSFEGREKARKMLKDKITFKTVNYPNYGKDVCDWSDEDIDTMIQGAKSYVISEIKRI